MMILLNVVTLNLLMIKSVNLLYISEDIGI